MNVTVKPSNPDDAALEYNELVLNVPAKLL
jgi:hypothetical protein